LVVGKEIYKVRDIEKICKSKMNERTIPTAADIEAVKAKKILNEVSDVMNSKNLRDVTKVIEARMKEESCTALEIAAAFLKLQLGEEREDIKEDKYQPMRRSGRKDEGRDRDHYFGRRSGKKDSWKKNFDRKEYDKKTDKKFYKKNKENGKRVKTTEVYGNTWKSKTKNDKKGKKESHR
jgi:ATP-dependent RNA helicase DeaD